MAYSWSTNQLTDYFAAVSAPQEEQPAIVAAVERATETLQAHLGAVVIAGKVRASVGLEPDQVPSALLRAAPAPRR